MTSPACVTSPLSHHDITRRHNSGGLLNAGGDPGVGENLAKPAPSPINTGCCPLKRGGAYPGSQSAPTALPLPIVTDRPPRSPNGNSHGGGGRPGGPSPPCWGSGVGQPEGPTHAQGSGVGQSESPPHTQGSAVGQSVGPPHGGGLEWVSPWVHLRAGGLEWVGLRVPPMLGVWSGSVHGSPPHWGSGGGRSMGFPRAGGLEGVTP